MSDTNPTIMMIDNDTETSWVVLSTSEAGGSSGLINGGTFVGNRKSVAVDPPVTIPNIKGQEPTRLFLQTPAGGFRIGVQDGDGELKVLIQGADGPAWNHSVESGATYELEVSSKGKPSLTKR